MSVIVKITLVVALLLSIVIPLRSLCGRGKDQGTL